MHNFALNGVKYVRTLRHIKYGASNCAMSAKTKTIGTGVEKSENFSKSRQFSH